MTIRCVLAATIALLLLASIAGAQSIDVGGAMVREVQRFDGDPSLNRLDGESLGWLILGGARFGNWMIRGEGSRDATILRAEDTSLAIGPRAVTIHSELAHDVGSLAVLGGYARPLSGVVTLTALGGVAALTVHRSFTTDAGQAVLLPPSTIPVTAVTTRLVDRFAVWTVEGGALVRVTHRLQAVAGLRYQPLSLKEDIRGHDWQLFAGAVWRLK